MKLAALIDFATFPPKLMSAVKRSDGSKGGRPPYDLMLMFRILILQTLYMLSDDATEFQIKDRLSFMRFLGLGLADAVPDAKTVWPLREQLFTLFASRDRLHRPEASRRRVRTHRWTGADPDLRKPAGYDLARNARTPTGFSRLCNRSIRRRSGADICKHRPVPTSRPGA